MSRALVNVLRTCSRYTAAAPRVYQPSTSSIPRTTLACAQRRWSSHSPLGSAPANARKPVTINTLQSLYRKGEPITMITAHDFPSAHVADHAGMDMILVGDSLAMVALGMEDTSEVLMEEMLLHCKSVARATKGAFTVCPYLSLHTPLLPLATTSKSCPLADAECLNRSATFPWEPMRFLPPKPSNLLSV